MALTAHDQKYIDDFFAAIKPVEAAYRHPVFGFVAIREGERFVLAQGALQLNTSESKSALSNFRSENVWAAQYRLSDLKLDFRGFVDALLAGKIETPDGDLHFLLPDHQASHSPYYMPFHDFGLEKQHRLNVLRLSGGSPLRNVHSLHIDWELKAAPVPYESLQDLAFTCRLGQLRSDLAVVEIIAYNVAAVDFNSKVTGEKAWPTVHLAEGLDTGKVLLGYRVQEKEGVSARASIRGDAITWKKEGDLQTGTVEVQIPIAAILHCIVSYDGIAQQFGWLVDPATVQNSRRAAFEAFDPRLERLNEIIENPQGKSKARDFEAVVSWLLWMLGFGVAHLGDTEKTQHAADLIAISNAGHIALVECTIGLLKADKLSKLHERADAVRRSVAASGNPQVHVLPVIATTKTRTEFAADLERAERLGIAVIAREDLEAMITRTRFVGNPDQIFTDAEVAAAFAQEKYQMQGSLSLPDLG